MKINLPVKICCKILILFSGVVYSAALPAQSNSYDTTNTAIAVHNAINAYHRFLAPQISLYNGSEYVDYAYTINEGIPFFETALFSTGTVAYDSILYENIPLLYDEILDEVVMQNINGSSKIKLNKEKITAFSLLNHQFIKLGEDSFGKSTMRPGFYDVLYEGKFGVYKKQTKKILESVTVSQGVQRIIDEQNDYFIKKDGRFYTINNKRDVLNLVKDKRKEILPYMKKNKLNMRRAKELSLVKIAAYYDQITRN